MSNIHFEITAWRKHLRECREDNKQANGDENEK